MKIWIIYPELSQPGGVNSWVENAVAGFRNLGHTVDLTYVTMHGRMNVSLTRHTQASGKIKHDERLPADCMAYGNDYALNAYSDRSLGYDIVLMAHPGPHPTKSYLRSDPNAAWKGLYSRLQVPCVVAFHDVRWKESNPWIVDVAPHVDGILAAQSRFYGYILEDKPFPAQKSALVAWDYQPIVFAGNIGMYENDKYTNPRTAVTVAQWISNKNYPTLIRQLCGMHSFACHMYGTGIVYYYQRKTDEWKCAIGMDMVQDVWHNHSSPHVYEGYISYCNIPLVLQQASVSVDASTRGCENMGIIEPMAYGCVSVVPYEILNSSPYQKLTEDVVVTAPSGMLVEAIEDVCLNFTLYHRERENALEYVRKHHTIEAVSSRIIKMFEMVLDGESGQIGGLEDYLV